MRKLVIVGLICAMAAVASAQDLSQYMWMQGGYWPDADPGIYLFDKFSGQAEHWVDLADGWSRGFADSGAKWYASAGAGVAIYNPAPQGGTLAPVATIAFGDLTGNASGLIKSLEWANGELYYLSQVERNITVEGYAFAVSRYQVGKFTLDANGVPTGATQGATDIYTRYYAADSLTGALSYNADQDKWMVRGFVNPFMVADDPLNGVWTDYAPANNNANDYVAAVLWEGYEGSDVIFWGRYQNTYVGTISPWGGNTITVATDSGFFDFSQVNAIPEPATLALLAIGGLGLIARRRRQM